MTEYEEAMLKVLARIADALETRNRNTYAPRYNPFPSDPIYVGPAVALTGGTSGQDGQLYNKEEG